eukprot:CAMPEP_0198683996 /NCGR_PEP_ID=MMETSP1468-20131203/11544_1 /TAXON_ID=1461545 /ORGANISM="Mantoniella sp, Strain CCMP1436" /LENGTH=35 /DNA_ID= /DNA_START= /DNA_END= /DNA_ORIENTATION=
MVMKSQTGSRTGQPNCEKRKKRRVGILHLTDTEST